MHREVTVPLCRTLHWQKASLRPPAFAKTRVGQSKVQKLAIPVTQSVVRLHADHH